MHLQIQISHLNQMKAAQMKKLKEGNSRDELTEPHAHDFCADDGSADEEVAPGGEFSSMLKNLGDSLYGIVD